MVVWSSISRAFFSKSLFTALVTRNKQICNTPKAIIVTQIRNSGHGPKEMIIRASDWQWDKFKDLLHFYLLVGAIPITLICIYTNVFIGPATLAPIPEGYEPKHWEYHKHPISRFIAKYIVASPQQEYEKMCHALWEEQEAARLRTVQKDVLNKMAERQDYQAWYYKPALVKIARHSKQYFEDHKIRLGD